MCITGREFRIWFTAWGALLTVLACVGIGAALPSLARAEICPNEASRSGPSVSLPDCRVYEMVSPIDNVGGDVDAPGSGVESQGHAEVLGTEAMEAAPNGNAVAYAADPPRTGGDGIGGNTYLATRSPGGGWTTIDIQPQAATEADYQAFSEELTIGVVTTCGVTPFSTPLTTEAPVGGYNVLYSHVNGDSGGAGYRALFSARPPKQLPCAHGESSFGSSVEGRGNLERAVLYAGGTADLGHILFEANDALTENAPETGAEENDLYDNVGGELHLVNVPPGQERGEADASFGSPWQGGEEPPDFSHVISSDGSRIFWTALEPVEMPLAHKLYKRPKALYARENGAQTVQVDAAEPGCSSCKSGGGWFWTASASGERVFFTDCHRLTADSTAVYSEECGVPNGESAAGAGYSPSHEPLGNDLYEWDEGRLTDLTVDEFEPGGANVKGVIGASENGEYVYFVAAGVLASGAHPVACAYNEHENLCNLYVRHDGVTTFIAALQAGDDNYSRMSAEGSPGDWVPDLGHRTAEVTPDGHSVVFMSNRSLTGYDNVLDGQAMSEVYVYDTEAEPHLVCASCDSSGAPPSVFIGSAAGASFLPTSLAGGYQVNTFQPRWISDEGDRVFFDSVEPLVPEDTNGLRNVYEWERDGAGSCRTRGGCIYLLSGWASPAVRAESPALTDASSFVAASANGDDVFFVTRSQLVSQDQNEEDDLYDARVDGVQPLSPVACQGTECQGVPSAPPIFATPPSATFSGVGNFEAVPQPETAAKPKAKPLTRAQKLAKALKACARDKSKQKRAACEKRARKEYEPASKGKAKKVASRGGRHV